MEKDRVIQMRDKLKAGKNLPLIIYIDNLFKKIDESNVFQFTKWDDENGILYNYSLTDPNLEEYSSNIGGSIEVFATDYEMIQAMAVPRLNLNDLGTSIESLGCISDEWKQRIIDRFKTALDPNTVILSREKINKAMGVVDGHKALDDSVDYYTGKYPQPFAETRIMADHNEYAKSVANKNNN